jgi:predicted DCC family thiol-disulfide oxidoreductase YuxK
MADRSSHPIFFFDGVCNLCNALVSFAVRADTKHVFRYAPLQGSTASDLIPEQTQSLSSVVLRDSDGRLFFGARAVLMFLGRLSAPHWRVVSAIASCLPSSWCESLYALVARHRYALFGRKSTCRIPAPSEKALFLP